MIISVSFTPVLDEDLSVIVELLVKSNYPTVLQSGGVGEGDCVKDDDCLEGLKCGYGKPGHHYNCLRDFGWGPPTFNCCYRPNVCVAQANLVCGSSCAAAASPTKCIGCDANAAKYSHDCCTKSNKCKFHPYIG